MRKISSLLYIYVVSSLLLLLGACSDSLGKEAEITISFKVEKEVVDEEGKSSKMIFNAAIEDEAITIKIAPHLDESVLLKDAQAKFYLSKGATVIPDPNIPQDFTQEGGVNYTVTSEDGKHHRVYNVTWGVSDILEDGQGFSFAEIGASKEFPQMGYPGVVNDFGQPDSKLYGDLLMYHAYCGDNIVLMSRNYILADPTSPHAIKVVNKNSLNPAGTLNLGSISISNLRMISSDYKGRCVGVVVNGNETEIFYWAQTSDAPKSVGKIGINLASTTDGSSNFQVAGDITGNAWITAMAPRSAEGNHYRIKVTDGKLATNYSMVKTGYSSSDCSAFQMISALDDSDEPSFAIGDTEGTAATANSIKCYINAFEGITTSAMPGLWQSTLQTWWVGTGFSTARTGGRAPVVSALPINGKSYVVVTSGTAWWHAAAVLDSELQTLAHPNLNIAHGMNRGWSYGAWVDWYWDDINKEAHLAVWLGRVGLQTYKLTCYE